MIRLLRFAVAAVAGLAASASLSFAQEPSLGQREYTNNCAACHGAAGKGDGILAGYLTDKLPDLSLLSRNNGGVFPVARMTEIIDGREAIGPHGTRDMPIWGDEYNAQAMSGRLGEYAAGGDIDAYVRARVLALVEYISTFQEP